jgi:tetratricopeptide (TPR) repeat protein
MFTARDRLEEARILLEGALELALANDLHSAAFRAFNNLAVNYESQDRYRDAAETTARAVELARKVGDRVWEEIARYGPISTLIMLGEWDEVAARAAEVDSDAVASVGMLLLPVVMVECARGDVRGARSRVDGSSLGSAEDPQGRVGHALAEAHVLRAEGRLSEALAAAELGIEAKSHMGTTFLSVKLCFVEGLEAAFALGDTGRVEELLAVIDDLRPGDRSPLLEAHAHEFRARLTGDEGEYRAAIGLFRELEMVFDLAVTLLEHGEATGSEASLAEAREIFERLGAAPWLERASAGVEVSV